MKLHKNFFRAKVSHCVYHELYQIFGIREGEEIEILEDFFNNDTIIVRHNNCEFCIRKSEAKLELERFKD